MIQKSIGEILESDLRQLIADKRKEDKTIEYKQAVPNDSDRDKTDFLADISSFANTIGGDYIIGISEDRETGEPAELVGVSSNNLDREKLRLESIILSGLSPRLQNYSINLIPLADGKAILLIRVSKSWVSPHRVVFKNHSEFYSRHSSGKYRLDVDELRLAFLASESSKEKIRSFITDRIIKISNNEGPFPLIDSPKVVLHLIPTASFINRNEIDIVKLASDPSLFRLLAPVRGMRESEKYNYDGWAAALNGTQGNTIGYIQLFRSGLIESADATIIQPRNDKLLIPSITFEEEIIKSASKYIFLFKKIDISIPYMVVLSLIGVKGWRMEYRDPFLYPDNNSFSEDTMIFPELLIIDSDTDLSKALMSTFNLVWNASGFPRSPYYTETGERRPNN